MIHIHKGDIINTTAISIAIPIDSKGKVRINKIQHFLACG